MITLVEIIMRMEYQCHEDIKTTERSIGFVPFGRIFLIFGKKLDIFVKKHHIGLRNISFSTEFLVLKFDFV
jgi:hypothetical protein